MPVFPALSPSFATVQATPTRPTSRPAGGRSTASTWQPPAKRFARDANAVDPRLTRLGTAQAGVLLRGIKVPDLDGFGDKKKGVPADRRQDPTRTRQAIASPNGMLGGCGAVRSFLEAAARRPGSTSVAVQRGMVRDGDGRLQQTLTITCGSKTLSMATQGRAVEDVAPKHKLEARQAEAQMTLQRRASDR